MYTKNHSIKYQKMFRFGELRMNIEDVSSPTINRLWKLIYGNENIVPEKIELEDSHESLLYKNMVSMPMRDIHYENISWIVDLGATYENLCNDCNKINSPVFSYVCNIIGNETYEKREKIVIILAHMEVCVCRCIDIIEMNMSLIKKLNKTIRQNDNHKVSNINYAKIYLLGIVKVVYANTDSFIEEIDKTIPFRNHILHNGIVDYTNEQIEKMYSILVHFFARLVECKIWLDFEQKMQEIDTKRK